MSLTHHRYFRVNRWLELSLALVLVVSCLIHPIAGVAGEGKPLKSRSGKAHERARGRRKAKKNAAGASATRRAAVDAAGPANRTAA